MEEIRLSDGQKEYRFELLDTFGVDEQEYASMLGEDDQVYIMEMHFEGDEAVFKTIENKKEFDEILEIYLELLDEDEE